MSVLLRSASPNWQRLPLSFARDARQETCYLLKGLLPATAKYAESNPIPKEFPNGSFVADLRQLERVVNFLEAKDPRAVDLSADSRARTC